MKKYVFLAAVMLVLILSVTAAFAVEATYRDGKITVTTGSSGFFEIIIDGTLTDRWVGTGMPSNTFSMKLEDGEHTVRLYSPDGDAGSSNKFWVGEKPDDTPAPEATEAPEAEPTVPVPEHTHVAELLPEEEPTCTKEGKTSGSKCSVCGEVILEQMPIPALGHRYKIVKHNDTTNSYECVRCGNKMQANVNKAVQNRYGNIILNEKGEVANYQAKGAEQTMVLSLEQAAEQVVLFLDNSLIIQLMREGYTQVEVVNGNADAVIDLSKITPSWFNTTEKVENYIFTIGGEAQVTVETLINGEKLVAETFAGVTVK
ncbi:MAG: hypothetical protein IKP72_07940 [Clostridia bacterium]|nr:hypothetical protein [Clostridia bacterium]